MDALQWIITVAVSLASGTVGGATLAPKIGMRTELGRRHLEAEIAIRGVLQTYRDAMKYRHAEVVIRQNYPADYVSLESQVRLAEEIIQKLPDLPRRRRQKIRRHLKILVGAWTTGYGEARAFLPEGFRTPQSEESWLNKRIADMVKANDASAAERGLLGRVNSDVIDQAAFETAVAAMDDMIALVSVDRQPTLRPRELWDRRTKRKGIESRVAEHEQDRDT
ncbi:hypothetical protein [Phytoactinopolyspora mesophila]|uniref:Uncharacterized protein n=1 Tax=Phytoactinopolyspora mesophila TaxID=2650750 RepID=A0A7K3M138_9ACTN|nr:hypothetical protein [Phytoactinopolyspora mesophila]NDL57013.1 hypothetical protein [Phytoactinopolyspora mesophila]